MPPLRLTNAAMMTLTASGFALKAWSAIAAGRCNGTCGRTISLKCTRRLTNLASIETRTGITEPDSFARLFGETDPSGAVQGRTENDANTYLASGSACLDLFFDSVPGISRQRLEFLLTAGWDESPGTALQIIFQLGDPRHGKGDLANFYIAMLWLHQHHPETFLANLKMVPIYSYHKALLELLSAICYGPEYFEDTRKRRTSSHQARAAVHDRLVNEYLTSISAGGGAMRIARERPIAWRTHKWASDEARQGFVEYVQNKDREEAQQAAAERKAREARMRDHAQALRSTSDSYSRVYDAVASIFAEALLDEQVRLDANESIGGLPAKWAPTPKGGHDKVTYIVDGIVERLYPATEYKILGGTHEDYLSFMRDRYRKLLTAHRTKAQVPEHYTGTSEWHLVNYKRMASRCRHLHGHVFEAHDKERYNQYLEDCKQQFLKEGSVSKGNSVSAGAVLPHQLLKTAEEAKREKDGSGATLAGANLQWLRLVEDVKAAGKLPSAVAVCDVSGSMHGTPMDVAVALSILLSDIADEPWRNRICTFSQQPQFVSISAATPDNLADRIAEVKRMDWGYNTNFQRVFDELLSFAQQFKVKPDEMVKTVFVFSDMEFDQADSVWATDVEIVKSKYQAAGYAAPKLVFWNLRPSQSRPSMHNEPGVAMLSGFSAGMLKSFLSQQLDHLTPLSQMLEALAPFEGLVVAAADLPVQRK